MEGYITRSSFACLVLAMLLKLTPKLLIESATPTKRKQTKSSNCRWL